MNFDPKKLIIPLLIVVFVAVTGLAVYFRIQVNDLRKHPEKITQSEVTDIVSKVGKLIELPDEKPTLATIADPNKLKDQPFFAKAKVGDKLLIYPNNRKAILYDPINNKLIEVAPLLIGGNK